MVGGAFIEGLAAQFDLESGANRVQARLVGNAGALQHSKGPAAMRAHPVGEGKALAHLAAALAAPLQGGVRTEMRIPRSPAADGISGTPRFPP